MLQWFPTGLRVIHKKDVGMSGNFEISMNGVLVHSKKHKDQGFLDAAGASHQNGVRASLGEILQANCASKALVRSHRRPMLKCEPASLEFLFDGRSKDAEVATLSLTNNDDGNGLGYVPVGWKGDVVYRLELGSSDMAKRYKVKRGEDLLKAKKGTTITLTKVAGCIAKAADFFKLSCIRVEPTKALADVYWDYPLDLAPVVTTFYTRTRHSEIASAVPAKVAKQQRRTPRVQLSKVPDQVADVSAPCLETVFSAIVPVDDSLPMEMPFCRRVVLLCA